MSEQVKNNNEAKESIDIFGMKVESDNLFDILRAHVTLYEASKLQIEELKILLKTLQVVNEKLSFVAQQFLKVDEIEKSVKRTEEIIEDFEKFKKKLKNTVREVLSKEESNNYLYSDTDSKESRKAEVVEVREEKKKEKDLSGLKIFFEIIIIILLVIMLIK